MPHLRDRKSPPGYQGSKGRKQKRGPLAALMFTATSRGLPADRTRRTHKAAWDRQPRK